MTIRSSSQSDEYARSRHRLVVIWSWVGGILLGAVALYLAGILAVPIGIIIWTAIIVFILSPLVNLLNRHGINRTVGTVIAFVVFAVILGALVFIMFSPTFGIEAQFEQLARDLPGYFESFNAWAHEVYSRYGDILQNETVKSALDGVSANFAHWMQDFASTGASGLMAFGTSVVNVFICIGFALVVAFWMLIELPNLGREAYRIIGSKYHEDAETLYLTVTRVMGGYLRTTIIQCAIIGVACGIMFAVLGVPSPAAFGVITGLLNIIPIIGPWLGGALAFVASFIESPLIGIIALIGTIIIQQVIYTFLSPKLMGESVDIHPALTFLALTAGGGIGAVMGGVMGSLIGTLLSIPLIAMVKSMFVYYFEKSTRRCIISPDGVFLKGEPAQTASGAVDPMGDATGSSKSASKGSSKASSILGSKVSRLEKDAEEHLEALGHHPHGKEDNAQASQYSANGKDDPDSVEDTDRKS